MPLIQARDQARLRELLGDLVHPVKLLVFTRKPSRLVVPGRRQDCPFCEATVQLVQEVAALSDKVRYEVVDVDREPERARRYGVDLVPAILPVDEQGAERGLRFYGIPGGYEFGVLVEDLIDLGRGTTRLSPATREALARVDRPVHIQVFVTPTCPYCPRAVRLAHQFALENPFITAVSVEATEFPELAERYHVYGVPKTVINEVHELEGAVPEEVLLAAVLQAAGSGEAGSGDGPEGTQEAR